MPKSKLFCVAVAGATVDGREIKPEWLDQMAASYNPATYGARVNMEHIRGFSADAPFNAYGSVLSAQVGEKEITIDGKTETRKALFALVDGTDSLVALNRDKQKVYPSVEINPNFAGTGKAYLVGLAVTDSPASIGTDVLEFTAKHSGTFVTPPIETQIEFEDAPADPAAGAFSAMAAFFNRMMGTAPSVPPVTPPPVVPPALTPPEPANDNAFAAQMREGLGLINASIVALSAKVDTDVGAIRTEFGTLKTQLDQIENPGFRRQPAPGGQGGIVADC